MAFDMNNMVCSRAEPPVLRDDFAEERAKEVYNLSAEFLLQLQSCMDATGSTMHELLNRGIDSLVAEYHAEIMRELGEGSM